MKQKVRLHNYCFIDFLIDAQSLGTHQRCEKKANGTTKFLPCLGNNLHRYSTGTSNSGSKKGQWNYLASPSFSKSTRPPGRLHAEWPGRCNVRRAPEGSAASPLAASLVAPRAAPLAPLRVRMDSDVYSNVRFFVIFLRLWTNKIFSLVS